MIYEHLNIQIPEKAVQVSQDGTGKRLYRIPNGDLFPSITTILSPLKTEILKQWRARVGDEIADAESKWARERGSALHLGIEDLLKNKSIKDHPLLIQMLIDDLKPYLLKIGKIYCQETPLYSEYFKIAGRVDCIAEYDGLLSVIDFKGSNRTKKREWIKDHFMQTAFYANAFWERTGYKVQQDVILMANEQGQSAEYIEKPWDWWNDLKKVRKEYQERFGI